MGVLVNGMYLLIFCFLQLHKNYQIAKAANLLLGLKQGLKKVKSRGSNMGREEEEEEGIGQDTVEKQLIMSPIK